MRDTQAALPPRTSSVPLDLTLLANRLALGAFFFLAGLSKIRMGVSTFYDKHYLGLRPPWLPEAFSWPYGHALPFIELGVGIFLAVGLMARLTASLIALMLISFSIALWQADKFFGGQGPFNTNILFFTLAALLAVTGPGRLSMDYFRRRSRISTPSLAPRLDPQPSAVLNSEPRP